MSKTAPGKTAMYAEVAPEVKATIAEIARATGLTKAETIEALVRNTRLGLDSRPRDWDVSLTSNMNQELPLADTA